MFYIVSNIQPGYAFRGVLGGVREFVCGLRVYVCDGVQACRRVLRVYVYVCMCNLMELMTFVCAMCVIGLYNDAITAG